MESSKGKLGKHIQIIKESEEENIRGKGKSEKGFFDTQNCMNYNFFKTTFFEYNA